MSRRGNAVSILITLLGDTMIGYLWYIIAFPSEPTEAMVTMGMTLLATLFTAIFGFLTHAVYKGCIADD